MEKKIIFHVPHDGELFPAELMRSVCVPREVFLRYHAQMRDTAVRLTVPPAYAESAVVFPVSRLLCDVERFIDGRERMEKYGMGFCYEKVYDGTVIKRVDAALKEQTLLYYHAHHERLNREVRGFRGRVVFFDMHSFSERTPLGESQQEGRALPDICLGFEPEYLPAKKYAAVRRAFRRAGFSTDVNYPYAGSLVPNAVMSGESEAELLSCMIEINKRLYLTPAGDVKGDVMERIRAIMTQLAETL